MLKRIKQIAPLDWIAILLAGTFGVLAQPTGYSRNGFDVIAGAFSGICFYLVLRFVVHIMTLGMPPITPLVGENSQVELLNYSFRDRARKLKIVCRFLLLAILASLVSGAWIFVYADIVARQTHATFGLRQLENEIRDSLARIPPIPPELPENRAYERDFNRDYQISKLVSVLSGLSIDIKKQMESVAEESRARSPTEVIISTLSTRIGSILLLLLLVQILVSLYRYNMKLAAFYDGRADALQLLGTVQGLKFEQLAQLTLADSLDFGKAEKAPADYALELTKKLLEKDRQRKDG